jgi:HAMP domain-containing protein
MDAEQAVYLWIVAAIILLCWALAYTLARPVRDLRQAVMRFSRGDLSVRARMKRRDEIGDLARSMKWPIPPRRCSTPSARCCRTFRMSCGHRSRGCGLRSS